MACTSFEGSKEGKLKSNTVNSVFKHNTRELVNGHQFKENIDPTRTHFNEYWVNDRWKCPNSNIPDYLRAVHDTMAERCQKAGRKPRKIQKNAVLVRSLVIQCTPEFFFPKLRGMDPEDQHKVPFARRGPIDQKNLSSWKTAVLNLIQKKFGNDLISYQLHLDERSPHFHCQILPVSADGRLADSAIFSPSFYDDFNDELGEATKHLGLERAPGGSRDPADRISVEDWHDMEQARIQKEAAARAEAEKIATLPSYMDKEPLTEIPEECEPDPLPPKPGIFASTEAKQEYQEAVANQPAQRDQNILALINDQRRDLAAVRQYAATVRTENNDLKKENAELAKENTRLAAENARLRKDFRPENKELRALPLGQILTEIYGATLIEKTARTCQYELNERKIAVSQGQQGEIFIDNHKHEFKGCGAINLVMQLEKINFLEAIGRLKDHFGKLKVTESLPNDQTFQQQVINKAPIPPVNFIPTKSNDITPAFKLTRERRINDNTVKYLLETGQIYVDQKKNIVVPRINGGCFTRGTLKPKPGSKPWKRTYGGKSCGPAVLRGPLCDPQAPPRIVEGVTDALAVLERFPDSAIYIIGGNLYPDLPPLPQDQHYIFMFDNDQEGQQHTEHYLKFFTDAEVLPPPPPAKDWGEAHITMVKQEIQEAREARQQPTQNHAPRPRM